MGALVEKYPDRRGDLLEPTGDGNLRAAKPLTDELRAAIRAYKSAILAELAANDSAINDGGVDRRRAKAIEVLALHAGWQRAVILEGGPPPILGVAIPSHYDPALLLALLEQHGETTQ